MEKLEFQHTQTPEESTVLTALSHRILSLSRIAVWAALSFGLTICLILATGEDNMGYAVPLTLLSGAISAGVLVLLIFSLRIRPQLLQTIRDNEGIPVQLCFQPKEFVIRRAGRPKLRASYRSVLGQYWYGDLYILHIRISEKMGGRGDEFLPLPLTQDTFDQVYLLASALEGQKKRLIRLKTDQPTTTKN